jgi:hypothetical protein
MSKPCTVCSNFINPERFELLYEGKNMKYCVCQECANQGIAQPDVLRGIVSCNENGEHEGLSVLNSYQWGLHVSAFGKPSTSELEQSIKEAPALEGIDLTV